MATRMVAIDEESCVLTGDVDTPERGGGFFFIPDGPQKGFYRRLPYDLVSWEQLGLDTVPPAHICAEVIRGEGSKLFPRIAVIARDTLAIRIPFLLAPCPEERWYLEYLFTRQDPEPMAAAKAGEKKVDIGVLQVRQRALLNLIDSHQPNSRDEQQWDRIIRGDVSRLLEGLV